MAGDLGVPDRLGDRRQAQLEGDVEHQEATGLLLEDARAIAESEIGHHESAGLARDAVVGAYPGDGLGHVLAVGADVLHRGGPDESGDACERLDTGPFLGDGVRDELVPRLAGRHGHERAAARVVCDLDPPRAYEHDGAADAFVGDDEVAAGEGGRRGHAIEGTAYRWTASNRAGSCGAMKGRIVALLATKGTFSRNGLRPGGRRLGLCPGPSGPRTSRSRRRARCRPRACRPRQRSPRRPRRRRRRERPPDA